MEPHIWTEEQKKEALEMGAVCCSYYFVCWRDPPPWERGACCKHMKDTTLCPGCAKKFEEENCWTCRHVDLPECEEPCATCMTEPTGTMFAFWEKKEESE